MITAQQAIERLGGTTSAARRLGLKRTTVVMWLKRHPVPPRHAKRVAKALEVDPADLLPDAMTSEAAE